jgi:hypothetical protein
MRRTLQLLICTAMLLGAGAADAGLRAIYLDGNQTKQLQIDVDDSGNARIGEAGSQDYGLQIGGDFYIVDMVDGKPMVARLKDVATAMDEVLPPIFKGLFAKAFADKPSARLRVEAGGAGEAGGRKGRIYHVRGMDETDPGKATDFLISSDADLKPVGAALEGFMNAAVVPMAPLIGDGVNELVTQTRTVFALGTPIDAGGRFRLKSVEPATMPADYFKPPVPAQTVEQLVASMKDAMTKRAGDE